MKILTKYVPTVIAALLAVGVVTAFKACGPMEDGTWMNCHNAQIQVFILAVLMTLIGIVTIFLKEQRIKLCLDIVSVVLAVIVIFVPGIITSLCMMDTMRCHTLMRPFAVLMSVVFIVIKVITILYERVLKKEQ